jgi:hypothetical protein
MKVVSLNLSTLGSGKYAPLDKTNLANVKWSINWKEVMGEYYNTNKPCRVKCKLISSASTLLNTTNNLGTVRASFSSNYSNITNGLVLGVPIITQTSDIASSITQFVGSISSTTLSVTPFGYGQMLSVIGGTNGISTTTLTISSAIAIPIGSVISGFGITGYVTITAQTSNTTYTMSSAQTITNLTNPITALLPNSVCLPIGALITGNGISSGTVITAQIGAYSYTVNNSQTISSIPMISNPTNYFLYLDTQESFGLSICTPMMNNLSIQFLKPDEQTLMTNVPEYTILINFDFDDKAYDSD